jgi:hypothetical protein
MPSRGRLPLGLIAAITMAVAASGPSPAGAATQIGQTFTPNVCDDGSTFLQSGSPGGQYAAPFAGVITSWSFQAPASPPQLKFKVARPAGGNDFTIVGEEGPRTPSASSLNTYPARIAVQAGDVIGFSNFTSGACERAVPGYTLHRIIGDVPPGTTATFNPLSGLQLDVSATLEPDCDSDGFGDETQDPQLLGGTCPKIDRTVTLDSNKGKTEKGRKVRLTGQVDAPGAEPACEPNQTVELQRKKKAQPDTAFQTFDSLQTDQDGNFADKLKVRKTFIYRAQLPETEACDDELSNTQKVRVQKPKAAKEA